MTTKTMVDIISAALEHSPALDCTSCDGAERAAAALSAAGYGPVKEAAAEALRDAAEMVADLSGDLTARHIEDSLRARAAALGADQ